MPAWQGYFRGSLLKPYHVDIYFITVAEYSQMSTDVSAIFWGFCIILYWPPAAWGLIVGIVKSNRNRSNHSNTSQNIALCLETFSNCLFRLDVANAYFTLKFSLFWALKFVPKWSNLFESDIKTNYFLQQLANSCISLNVVHTMYNHLLYFLLHRKEKLQLANRRQQGKEKPVLKR